MKEKEENKKHKLLLGKTWDSGKDCWTIKRYDPSLGKDVDFKWLLHHHHQRWFNLESEVYKQLKEAMKKHGNGLLTI